MGCCCAPGERCLLESKSPPFHVSLKKVPSELLFLNGTVSGSGVEDFNFLVRAMEQCPLRCFDVHFADTPEELLLSLGSDTSVTLSLKESVADCSGAFSSYFGSVVSHLESRCDECSWWPTDTR
uniref:Uncharacterized protein n=1 Tax=Trypanosoma congolense (strain IL3000) TaxID=1068625 RepID=G0UTA3_TRYCI|nr:hypothetical protein, unlikely [Trypanosoma congolense IL3000]